MGDRIKIDPAYRGRLAELALDAVEKVLGQAGGRVVHHGPQCELVQIDVPAPQPALYVKRFHYPSWRIRLHFLGRCFFGRSRAKREFRCLRLMHRLGIQSSRALSWGERRVFGFLAESYLILEGVPASDSLRDFAVRYFHKAASPRGRQLKRAMMDQLADQVRQMHGRHFYHGELTWENILIRPTPRGDFEFFFINPLRGKRAWIPWKARRLRARDLAGIDAIPAEFLSRADKIRFIKRYLQRDQLTERDRTWMKRIQQIGQLLYARLAAQRASSTAAAADPSPSRQVQPGVHS